MKRLLIILFIVSAVGCMLLVGCNGNISQEEYDRVVAERDALLEQTTPTDEIIIDNPVEDVPVEETPVPVNNPIDDGFYVLFASTSTPNSAGGVDVQIGWYNDTRQIKYIYFTVTPYNAVNDVVQCTIRAESEMNLQKTGPVETANPFGSMFGESASWENVWYNNTIRSVEIEEMRIVFMDDTEILYTNMNIYTVGGFYEERNTIWIEKGVFTRTLNSILREMNMTLAEYREEYDHDDNLKNLDNPLINGLTVHQISVVGEDLGFTVQDFFRVIIGE